MEQSSVSDDQNAPRQKSINDFVDPDDVAYLKQVAGQLKRERAKITQQLVEFLQKDAIRSPEYMFK